MSFDLDNGHAPVVLDIAGTTLNADDRRRLQHPLTGGLILFARNWESRAQLTALTAEIKAVRPDVLVCVDHEGGRVQRFRSDGFTHLPPMRTLGELWMRDALAATDAATACGHVLGAELRACGVDLSFTPVLDLDHGGSSVIGDRAFHRDARVATMQFGRCTAGWLVPAEGVAAQRPGQGRRAGVGAETAIAQCVAAGWQRLGQGRQGIRMRGGTHASPHRLQPAVVVRQQGVGVGRAGEAHGGQPGAGTGGSAHGGPGRTDRWRQARGPARRPA